LTARATPAIAASLPRFGQCIEKLGEFGVSYGTGKIDGKEALLVATENEDKGKSAIRFAGGVILAAALYQLTPLKDACLSRCRSPLDFLTERWRDGVGGALRLGLEHRAWCVGCCWALMAALFALGVMSVAWMALIVALIAAEKLLPWKAAANRGIAVLLVILGLAVALVPERVPGLAISDSPGAMQAMEAMGDR
jgi:predicted metal-binding membrane protein